MKLGAWVAVVGVVLGACSTGGGSGGLEPPRCMSACGADQECRVLDVFVTRGGPTPDGPCASDRFGDCFGQDGATEDVCCRTEDVERYGYGARACSQPAIMGDFECQTDDDCSAGEVCELVPAPEPRTRCFLPCMDSRDCPVGGTCEQTTTGGLCR